MTQETMGTVIAVKKQWWLKVNTKPVRKGAFDGAIFPHVIKVKYTAEDKEYTKRKWIHAGNAVPHEGSTVKIIYSKNKPSKAKVV